MEEDVESRVKRVVVDYIRNNIQYSIDNINGTETWPDFGMDSLNLAEITLDLEDEFSEEKLSIPYDKMPKMKNIRDLITYIQANAMLSPPPKQ